MQEFRQAIYDPHKNKMERETYDLLKLYVERARPPKATNYLILEAVSSMDEAQEWAVLSPF